MQKPRCCAKPKIGPGVEKTPTVTPAGFTKTGTEGLKPRLKDGLVFGKTPVGVWTTGSALLKTGSVVFKRY